MNVLKNRMIPNCIIYDVYRNDSKYFYNMITTVLGKCVHKIYIHRSGNGYDVLIVFKNVSYLTQIQHKFVNTLDYNNPIRIDHHGETYHLYKD